MSDELDIYRRQRFAQTLGLGHVIVLVIIDFVVGFTDPTHFGGPDMVSAIKSTSVLLAHGQRHWKIAHTRVVYADDGADAGVFAAKVPALLTLTEESPLSQIVPELKPAHGELLIRERQLSAFFATDFTD